MHGVAAGAERAGANAAAPPRRAGCGGWLAGALLGIGAALLVFPAVRQTALAQAQFALSPQNWFSRAAAGSYYSSEQKRRLLRTAARYPTDYLIQLGSATSPVIHRSVSGAGAARAAARLAAIAAQHPDSPGIYAHIARYLIEADMPVSRRQAAAGGHVAAVANPALFSADVRALLEDLHAGWHRDLGNGYFPALIAAVEFAVGSNRQAESTLSAAARMPRWNSYLYEQVLGQWRLTAAAYGDLDAARLTEPLSYLQFAHLRLLREMTLLARARAYKLAGAGHANRASRLLVNVAWVGHNLRTNSDWMLEALCGADMEVLASTNATVVEPPASLAQWIGLSSQMRNLLHGGYYVSDIGWLHNQAEASLDLRKDAQRSGSLSSDPVIAEAPVAELLGTWMLGVLILRQAGLLILIAVTLPLWLGSSLRLRLRAGWGRLAAWLFVVGAAGACVVSATAGLRSGPIDTIVAGCGVALLAMAAEWWFEHHHLSTASILPRDQWTEAIAEARAHWRWSHVLVALALLAAAAAAGIALALPQLALLHPLAELLSSSTGLGQPILVEAAWVRIALSFSLSAILIVGAVMWALRAGISPAAACSVACRRAAPAMALCLAVAWVGVLTYTVMLDTEAGASINQAVMNNRQWVLAHIPSQ
ncbi:MAG: hypothetical protein KGJ62_13065 [Armatimonadetes bacterium]|nr:hypothetical protein [Armatimonadota bacterium]MDE2206144.1 hypothetical protein [Armatimonadota bacterium]